MTKQRASQKKLKVTEVETGSEGDGHKKPDRVVGAARFSGDVGMEDGSVTGGASATGDFVDVARGSKVRGSAGSAGIRDAALVGGEEPLPDDDDEFLKETAADQNGDDHISTSVRSRVSSVSSVPVEDSGSFRNRSEFSGRVNRGQESPRGLRLMPEVEVRRETETFEAEGGLHRKIETAIQGAMKTAMKEMASVLSTTLKETVSEMRQEARCNAVSTEVAGKDSSRQKQRVLRPQYQSSSSSEDEQEDYERENSITGSDVSTHGRVRRQVHRTGVKLPPFTGKETWKVWFNRFSEISERKRWSDEEKLDEMLPRLQGAAGEFVFGELDKKICSNYKLLVNELKSRFRKVETAKNFGAQFNHRSQKSNETVEAYAAELKRLYDKGFASRDAKTRREDLLRRFLDGLIDEKASFQVEYIKDPKDIDEAVFEVVSFMDAKQHSKTKESQLDRRHRKATRMVRPLESDTEDESDDGQDDSNASEKVARVQEKRPNNKGVNNRASQPARERTNFKDKCSAAKSEVTETVNPLKDQLDAIVTQLEKLQESLTKNQTTVPFRDNQFKKTPQQGQRFQGLQCFNCGVTGHFARDCPNKSVNQGFAPRPLYSQNKMQDVEPAKVQQLAPNSETTQKTIQPSHDSFVPTNQSN